MNTQPSLTLINCPVCDKQVSNKAVSCPNCGHPLTETESPPKMTQAKPSASPEATVQPQPVAAEPSASPQITAQPQPAVRAQSAAKSDFTVGQILKSTVSTLFKKPIIFYVNGIFVGLMSLLFSGTLGRTLIKDGVDADLVLIISGIIDNIICTAMVASVVHVVYRVLRQQTIDTEQAIDLALDQARVDLPMFGAAALVGLVIFLGSMFFVVPGVILMVMLAFTIPILAIENLGFVDSIKRSVELSKGYRLPIFGLFMISGLLDVGFDLLFAPTIDSKSGFFVTYILPRLLNAIPFAFDMVMTSIIYLKLREIKEGVTLDRMTGSFGLIKRKIKPNASPD